MSCLNGQGLRVTKADGAEMKTIKACHLVSAFAVCWLGCALPDAGQPVESVGAISQNIVNGEKTDWEIWRGVVGVVQELGGADTNRCTGTLIHPDVVLTAGHCVYSTDEEPTDLRSDASTMVIRVGASMQTSHRAARIQQALVHPQWPGDYEDGAVDLALLHLSESIDYLPNYCLRFGDPPNVDDSGIIVGYGRTSSSDSTSGDHRFGEITVLAVSPEELEGGDGSGSCEGDSGGPVFMQSDGKWRIAAVTRAHRSGECNAVSGNFSVNVATYTDWIVNQVTEWTGETIGDTCSASDMDDEPEPACGLTDAPCCGIEVCFDDNPICLPDLHDPQEPFCRAYCAPPACTTIEGTSGVCFILSDATFNYCEADEPTLAATPMIACSATQPCAEGTCLWGGCHSTDCSPQSTCSDGSYCSTRRDVDGTFYEGICQPLPEREGLDSGTSTDAGTTADAGTDADAAAPTDPPTTAGTGGSTDPPPPPPAAGAAGDTPPPSGATGGAPGATAGTGGAGGVTGGAGGTGAGAGTGATAAADPNTYAGSGGSYAAESGDDGNGDGGGGCSVSRVGSNRPLRLAGLLLLTLLAWTTRRRKGDAVWINPPIAEMTRLSPR